MFLKDAIEMRIKNLCKENDITINKLCTICGITQSTLANLKARTRTNMSTLTILRICRGLNITLEDFFNDDLFKNNESYTENDYINFFNDIDLERLSKYEIEYNEEWLKEEYIPKINYLTECLIKQKFPDKEEFKEKEKLK